MFWFQKMFETVQKCNFLLAFIARSVFIIIRNVLSGQPCCKSQECFDDKTGFPFIKTAPTSLSLCFAFGNPYLYPTLFQNFQPYFCHTFSQEGSRKSDMVIFTQVLAFLCTRVLAFSCHKHFGGCHPQNHTQYSAHFRHGTQYSTFMANRMRTCKLLYVSLFLALPIGRILIFSVDVRLISVISLMLQNCQHGIKQGR